MRSWGTGKGGVEREWEWVWGQKVKKVKFRKKGYGRKIN